MYKTFFLIVGAMFSGLFSTSIHSIQGSVNSYVLFEGDVQSLEWSPDGKKLALQGANGSVLFSSEMQMMGHLEETDYIPPNDSFDEYSQSWGVGVSWDGKSKLLAAPYYDTRYGIFGMKVWDTETNETVFQTTLSSDNSDIAWNKGR